MQSLTLEELFGSGTTQTSTSLIINKSSLLGLTLSPANRSQQLLIAICLKALEIFEGNITDELGNIITNENNTPITYNNSELYELLKVFLWEPKYLKIGGDLYVRQTIVIEQFTNAV